MTTAPADAYRQMLRSTFEAVSRGLSRLQRQLDAAEPADTFPADLTIRVRHLRTFVDALDDPRVVTDPALASALHELYRAALSGIEARIADADAAGACRLANRVVALLTVELTWLTDGPAR